MANAKIRVNTSKSTSNRSKGLSKIGKLRKLLTGINVVKTQSAIKSPKKRNNNVKDTANNLIKDRLVDTELVKDSSVRSEIQLSNSSLLTKQCHIRLKKLQTKLSIDDKNEREDISQNNSLNNNNLIVNNQNAKQTNSIPEVSVSVEVLDECSQDNRIKLKKKKSKKEPIRPRKIVLKKKPKHPKNTEKRIRCSANGIFTCDYCGKKYNAKSTLSRHISTHLDSINSRKIVLKKKKKPEKRIRKLYKGLFICDYCGKQFETKSLVRRHIYIHLDLTTFPCTQCKKVFGKQLYLTAHVTRQHPNWERHYMCNVCDKPFLLKENLATHLACHSGAERMFKCIYCREKFSEQVDLVKHEKQHLVSGLYDCIICEESFDTRNKLSMHFKTHLKVKEYICQHCGKEFIRLNSMKRHVQICHGGLRIQCHICKKYLKGHLSEHLRTHEKKRPHKCPDCGQCFTQSTQLTVHRRSHTGARPYPCRICKRPFSHSNALMLHIRRHTGEKPFECAMCPISFSQLPHMKAHMQKIHGKDNPYRCKKCKQFFKLKVDLENHSKNCKFGEKELSFEERIQASVQVEEEEVVESVMTISRMRFLLALLLTMIATKEKLKILGFNKRLIDDLLVESIEAMGHTPCKDESLPPIKRLKTNIETLLNGTVPKEQMAKFRKENKSTEDILELLTNEKK